MSSVSASETRASAPSLLARDSSAFAPGTMLADRYRIVALVGRGGMGEVYRADDMRLGQPVALKFLPPALEDDPAARTRMLAEVRSARSIAHPNVCRVYDIGEVAGRTFLTMEYIDGEDLASLLRRIGRLPPDKALEVARQVTAGLAAAHDQGVLHRDLKPANVMIDGRGQARITDFGLAVETAAGVSPADFAGTVAFMAPERFRGVPATMQSDLYSLGLILYEAFTGRPPFKGSTLGEWEQAHTSSTPSRPSVLVPDLPTGVERAILQCLEKDPVRRPRSAAQVALALPGGDPLAAALAAGETPSPELVAASGEDGTLPRGRAWLRFGLALGCSLLAMVTGAAFWSLPNRLALPHPELQRERAQQILRSAGYGEAPADEAWWMRRNTPYLQNFASATDRGRALAGAVSNPAAMLFCYRQSPVPLVPTLRVSTDEPAALEAGDAYVELDMAGRLAALTAVPSRRDVLAGSRRFDWTVLLSAAGLDVARLTPVEPSWGPLYAFDERAAWEGKRGGETLRVEAAARHGRATYFQAAPVWMSQAPTRLPGVLSASAVPLLAWIVVALNIGGVGFLGALAVRNLRLGRGDRRGALRLAAVVVVLLGAGGLLGRHWALGGVQGDTLNATPALTLQFGMALGPALFIALQSWLAYVGFEPSVRRRWPHLLIASTRLLDGRWRDPLVGRSVLDGILTAAGMYAGMALVVEIVRMAGGGTWVPSVAGFALDGVVVFVAYVAYVSGMFLLFGLMYLAVLLAARLALRSTRAAWLGVLVAFFAMYFAWGRVFLGPYLLVTLTVAFALAGSSVFVLWKSGLLALGVWFVVMLLLRDTPWTLALTRWYAAPTWTSAAIIVGLAFWGFKNVLGRQALFPTEP